MLARSPYTVTTLDHYGIDMLVDVRDPAISKPILALGEYEKGLASRLLAFVVPDTHFLDIGANIGFFTLAVARRAERGRVWSIEPDPQNVRLLRASVALNGFEDRVEVRHEAASDIDGDIFFSTLGYQANLGARFTAKEESTLLSRSIAGAPRPTKVRARTMDAALRGERIDLVKIDVEGHEPAVLKGMREFLTRSRPVVFSEFAPGTIQHISKTNPADMLRYMCDLGYLLSVVNEDGTSAQVKDGAEGLLARYDRQQHHIDLLFIPKELANQASEVTARKLAEPQR
ncbi:FkbM family methyltransferase [Thermosphaera sp.]